MEKILLLFSALMVGCASHVPKEVTLKPIDPKFSSKAMPGNRKATVSEYKKQQSTRSDFKVFAPPQLAGRKIIEVSTGLKSVNEGHLFGEMQDQFESRNYSEFDKKYLALTQQFPKSLRIDEAHYMKGLLELSRNDFGASLRALNQVVKHNPHSRKMPAVLYAKAQLYKKMNLEKEARDMLQRLRRNYSGSPEAVKAEADLRMMK